jgi:3-hydroxyacyl-CoA dehydrogenase / 3-hydroxy-2-methylbutyryl-CoA dehydrogenase
MKLSTIIAIVTGGASGLGEATVRSIVSAGGRAAILDMAEDKGTALAGELGDKTLFIKTDVANEAEVTRAIAATVEKFGSLNAAINCAGIASASKTVGGKGPFPLNLFELTIRVNLIGTFNVIRLAAAKMAENTPDGDGERGVIVNTASVAAFDGQIGQADYSASKAGIVGMPLPVARDLASLGIRNNTIAPGIFETPMTQLMPDAMRQTLIGQVPFPSRFGRSEEFASLVMHLIENSMINGETIRIDGAVRMSPK